MSALDWAGVGGLIGLLIAGVMWWRIDIAPQIRRLRQPTKEDRNEPT